MKTKFLALLTFGILTSSFAADLGLDPAYLELKVYKFAVSKSEFCTDLVTVFETNNPIYEDFLSNPSLGNGNIEVGTYPCVVIEFSDVIRYASTTTSDSGICVANEQHSAQICRANNNEEGGILIDGTAFNCEDAEQRIALYLSTGSIGNGGDNQPAFLPPTAQNRARGLTLLSPLVVSKNTVAKFIVDGRGQVEDTTGRGWPNPICEMSAPTFSFGKK
ncbi:MAG: hypothetical protein A2X86_08545 [Bdellovibrionales bacterium GWA2_49_15]|nr:MAG: hypothetical protein A2X86_08545 [Bdellovibrionales bacterium GWA2_49_15]HAZ11189.1 hypothetical protein [Bdellovibrionales bacterium]